MPSKVNFTFELDDNGDQALLGDYYPVIVNLQPDEDIVLQDLKLEIEAVEIETTLIQGGELVPSTLELSNLMTSQIVDESFKSTNLSISTIQSAALQKSIIVHRTDQNALGESKAGAAPLFSRMDNTSQLKDVEIFYLLNPRTDHSLIGQMTLDDVAAIDEENSKL